MTAMSL